MQHQIRLSPREYVARATVGYSGKNCHWHTAGRPELDTGKRVQGRDAEFPSWTPSWPLTAWAWLAHCGKIHRGRHGALKFLVLGRIQDHQGGSRHSQKGRGRKKQSPPHDRHVSRS